MSGAGDIVYMEWLRRVSRDLYPAIAAVVFEGPGRLEEFYTDEVCAQISERSGMPAVSAAVARVKAAALKAVFRPEAVRAAMRSEPAVPTLVIGGEADTICPRASVEGFAAMLREAGRSVELAILPGEHMAQLSSAPAEYKAALRPFLEAVAAAVRYAECAG